MYSILSKFFVILAYLSTLMYLVAFSVQSDVVSVQHHLDQPF